MFNIKLVFKTWGNPQRVPLRVKYWYSIKYVFKTKFHLKILKFVANNEKAVLDSYESPLGDKVLDLDKPYLTTPQD